ncbi:short-chain fatty acid transporter [Halorussus salinus]|uniref:short-chain fatty acid transporter n=1 Tax=Halorussus salinus TaxID=1364935 RepID=UPI00109273FE|nr:TIGR00366 family protein [Halorussus salinus]
MSSASGGTAIQRLGARISEHVERWMPSPFLFAIILSYVVFGGGLSLGNGPAEMVGFWYDGFWSLLTFAMQMVLILVTGYALAYHPWVQRAIGWLTSLPNDGKQAVVLVGVLSMVVAWIHWGLGLIAGAVIAREMGRQAHERDISVHYPLLCVAGYMGMGLTWHWGLAASAPLLMNTEGNVFVEEGVVSGLIPPSQTIFHPYTLALTVLGIAYAAVVLYLLAPPKSETDGITEYVPENELFGREDEAATDGGELDAATEADAADTTADEAADPTIGERIDHSNLLGGLIALGGVLYVGGVFVTDGLDALSLDTMNFAFLFLGLLLYTAPKEYQEQFYEAVSSTGGIILQFPLYAGIMGMMNSSGLSEVLAETLVSVSTPATFPAVAWMTAGIVNVFVPSGGGEWTVIGPIVIDAAQDLGVPLGQTTVAYAVGDAHTNLLQPFWALPLLGITGMRARDMFGYAVTMLLLLVPFLAIALTVIPY